MKKTVLLLIAFVFAACSHFADEDSPSDTLASDTTSANGAVATEAASVQMGTFSSVVSLGGALPSTFLSAADAPSAAASPAKSRSALPSLPADMHYYIVATPDSGNIYTDDQLLVLSETNTFSVPLTIGKTWALEVGIKNADGADITLTGGEISDGLIAGSAANVSAAGVWLNSSSSMTMSGGSICRNKVIPASGTTGECAAVHVLGGCTFEMTGGEISENLVDGSLSGIVLGGSLFVAGSTAIVKIGGEALIPYGVTNASGAVETGVGKNNVYLAGSGSETATITVTGELSASETAATITLNEYKQNNTVLTAAAAVDLSAVNDKFDITPPSDNADLFYVSDEGKLTSIFSYTNGVVSGSEEKDGTHYELVKYSYINHDNLKLYVDDYFTAHKNYTVVLKVDGVEKSVGTEIALDDGYRNLSATLIKAGSPTLAVAKNVSVKIKTVKVYISSQLHGWYRVDPKEKPCPGQTFYLQAENPDGSNSEEKSFYLRYDGGSGSDDGKHARNYYWNTPSDKNYVYLTSKESKFYFWANNAYDFYTRRNMGKINKGCDATTRTLAQLKANRSFDSSDRNTGGNLDWGAGDRSRIWISVGLTDTSSFSFVPGINGNTDSNGFSIIEVDSDSSTVSYTLDSNTATVKDNSNTADTTGTLAIGTHTLTAAESGTTVTEKIKVVQKLSAPVITFTNGDKSDYKETKTTELKDSEGNVVSATSYDIEYYEVEKGSTLGYSITSPDGGRSLSKT